MKKNIFYIPLLFLLCCKSKEVQTDEEKTEVQTPVTVTTVSHEPMEDYVELNATSTFLQKWDVKANITGYLQTANVQLNQPVTKGEILYTVKTKEAESIGNTISILDSTLKFTGINKIPAVASGFISQINHQAGDYVQEGEPLAVITDTRSFVFLLDMPYELRPYVMNKKSLEMVLPDGEKLNGIISGTMPGMDPASQTQKIILKVNAPHFLPENLIAKVKVVKSEKNNTASLPKSALLTDETQSEFWVMKLIDSSTAVKVPVKKGIETGDKVEILSPPFSPSDRIVVTGNYGLPDTAKVKIVQQ
ncbi:MAG TPA: HlyD family efflux transporter periplasmic adaptor subunit [Chitinophagaceae bacterium]|nr:HlyD family efflux transporter periplasmic adaptor subunit [Chitinophagaceae bacterium]